MLETFTQKILIVDDDPLILRMVSDKLVREGYDVVTAPSGQVALDVIEVQGLPHLAIVDINMPGMDGFDFCRIVQSYSDLPVVMLTAVDEEETIIRGISNYAEDYITKPFSPRELVARIQRVLRRISDFAYTLEPVITVDTALKVDFNHQRVFVNNQPVDLTPTETKILYILMRNAGQIVTTGFLLQRLWPFDEVFEDTLRVHLHRLRKKIQHRSEGSPYIVTERGVGYRFAVKPA